MWFASTVRLFKMNFKSLFIIASSFVFLSCVHHTYPKHWWDSVHDKDKPGWEILPQEAQAPQVILSKRNELGLLSNFAETPFVFRGKMYQSVEGFWQATKFPENDKDPRYSLAHWPYTRAEVEQMVGIKAKRAGDFASLVMKKNNIPWVSFNSQRMIYRQKGESPFYLLIREVMIEKVRQNQKVRDLLISTGELELMPDHHQAADLPKAWHYAKIYQEIRQQLKKNKF